MHTYIGPNWEDVTITYKPYLKFCFKKAESIVSLDINKRKMPEVKVNKGIIYYPSLI